METGIHELVGVDEGFGWMKNGRNVREKKGEERKKENS